MQTLGVLTIYRLLVNNRVFPAYKSLIAPTKQALAVALKLLLATRRGCCKLLGIGKYWATFYR